MSYSVLQKIYQLSSGPAISHISVQSQCNMKSSNGSKVLGTGQIAYKMQYPCPQLRFFKEIFISSSYLAYSFTVHLSSTLKLHLVQKKKKH